MTDCTLRHQCRITFCNNDEKESKVFDVYTPKGVTDKEIKDAILKTHGVLCEEKDIYHTLGRTPDTLVSEVFSSHNWIWHEPEDTADGIDIIEIIAN